MAPQISVGLVVRLAQTKFWCEIGEAGGSLRRQGGADETSDDFFVFLMIFVYFCVFRKKMASLQHIGLFVGLVH